MTQEEYEAAYIRGFNLTVGYLISRGLPNRNAEEIAQEAWINGWKKKDQLRDFGAINTWMNISAWRIALDEFGKSDALRNPASLCSQRVPDHSVYLNARFDARRILALCCPKDSVVLWRYYYEGFTAQEMRDRFYPEIEVDTVKVRLLRARISVRQKLNIPEPPKRQKPRKKP